MTINTSGTIQPSTKQHIFTKVHLKCLFMIRFSKLKLVQNAGKLLYTSKLGSVSNLGAKISQIQLSQAVKPALE